MFSTVKYGAEVHGKSNKAVNMPAINAVLGFNTCPIREVILFSKVFGIRFRSLSKNSIILRTPTIKENMKKKYLMNGI